MELVLKDVKNGRTIHCVFYFQGLAYLHMKGKMHRDIKVNLEASEISLAVPSGEKLFLIKIFHLFRFRVQTFY